MAGLIYITEQGSETDYTISTTPKPGSYQVAIGDHKGKDIILGGDHRGFNYKAQVKSHLESKGYHVADLGTHSTERCDYPLISANIGKLIDKGTVGIGMCGSGIGILIPASKYLGVYPARCLNPDEAKTSRMHNNSNCLGLAIDRMTLDDCIGTIDSFLETPFFSNPEGDLPYLKRFFQTMIQERYAIQAGYHRLR